MEKEFNVKEVLEGNKYDELRIHVLRKIDRFHDLYEQGRLDEMIYEMGLNMAYLKVKQK